MEPTATLSNESVLYCVDVDDPSIQERWGLLPESPLELGNFRITSAVVAFALYKVVSVPWCGVMSCSKFA